MADFVFNPYDRGGGRSTRQMQLAPQKFIFVVHTHGMMNHARTLQRKHVPDKDVEIVLTNRVYERVVGTTEVVVVDHAAVDHLSSRDAFFLSAHMGRYNP